MKAQILFLLAGLALGAGIVLVAKPFGGDASEQTAALSEATARIAALEAQVKEGSRPRIEAPDLAPSAVAPESPHIAAADGKGEEEKPVEVDPRAAFAKLMNSKEARALAKQMTAAFSANSERFVSGMVERYKEKFGLNDDQVASITRRMTDYAKTRQERFSEGLDNENTSIEELMREQGRGREGEQDEIAAILKDELTEDQFAQYEREQLVQQAERVERQSQRELDRLSGKLELTETQQDQVFDALVRTSPGYDASMQIEGAGATAADAADTADAAADPEAARQEAIRAVLTPEQAVKYDEDLANPEPASPWGGGRFGGFGGGGFGGGN